jgi:hypothetical protein
MLRVPGQFRPDISAGTMAVYLYEGIVGVGKTRLSFKAAWLIDNSCLYPFPDRAEVLCKGYI